MYGFGEGCIACRRESGRRRDGCENVWWEEMQGKREVGGGENSESFDEDVGYCFVFGEVGIELVSGDSQEPLVCCFTRCDSTREEEQYVFQIELIINFKGWRDSFSMPIQVIGNVKETIII